MTIIAIGGLWIGAGCFALWLFGRMARVGMSELQPYTGVERRKVPR